jgi:hypothetical protein
MANGKPGDHPITDWEHHGAHPFPPEIEELLTKLRDITPLWWQNGRRSEVDEWDRRFFAWERGEDIEAGIAALRAKLGELERR